MKLKTKWKIDYQNDEYNTFAQILYGLMKLMLPDFWTRKAKNQSTESHSYRISYQKSRGFSLSFCIWYIWI